MKMQGGSGCCLNAHDCDFNGRKRPAFASVKYFGKHPEGLGVLKARYVMLVVGKEQPEQLALAAGIKADLLAGMQAAVEEVTQQAHGRLVVLGRQQAALLEVEGHAGGLLAFVQGKKTEEFGEVEQKKDKHLHQPALRLLQLQDTAAQKMIERPVFFFFFYGIVKNFHHGQAYAQLYRMRLHTVQQQGEVTFVYLLKLLGFFVKIHQVDDGKWLKKAVPAPGTGRVVPLDEKGLHAVGLGIYRSNEVIVLVLEAAEYDAFSFARHVQ